MYIYKIIHTMSRVSHEYVEHVNNSAINSVTTLSHLSSSTSTVVTVLGGDFREMGPSRDRFPHKSLR